MTDTAELFRKQQHRFVPGIDHGPGLPPRCISVVPDSSVICLQGEIHPIHRKMIVCEGCDGSGIAYEEEAVIVSMFDGIEKVAWEFSENRPCQYCVNGREWEGLL